MSVLIKGMGMPKNCDSCPCYYETEGAWRDECEVLGREHYLTEERPSWCPLVEIPPHGRLIDADALMQSLGITNMECDKCAWCDSKWGRCMRGSDFEDSCCAIEDAPTIIEAEEGE